MSGFSSIDPQSLAALSSGGSCKIVDVRTHQEVLQGRIEGALHIPLHELAQRFTEIGADQPVVFYCQSGARSLQASAFLAARGVGACVQPCGRHARLGAKRPADCHGRSLGWGN